MRRALLIVSFLLLPVAAFAQAQPLTPSQPDAAPAADTTAAVPAVPNADMLNQAGQVYNTMTPDQKQAAVAQARQQYAAMTPEQKQALEDQAKKQWQSMTPDQQDKLKSEFAGMLGGAAAGNSQ